MRSIIIGVVAAASFATMFTAVVGHFSASPKQPVIHAAEEGVYGKGDKLWIRNIPLVVEKPAEAPPAPPPPSPISVAQTVEEVKSKPEKEKPNLCERHGGYKVITGRSWHCAFKHH